MDKLLAFLKEHTPSTHVLALIGAGLVAAYYQVPAFHDIVFGWYGLLPQTAKQLITTAIALYAWYRNSYKPGEPEATEIKQP